MKRYAVFVGINSYTNDITPLSCACQDAKELSMEFAASGFERPVLLLDSDAGSGQVLSELSKICKSIKPDDLLVFYFAGHGRELNNEHYLVCPEGYAKADLFNIDSISVSNLISITNKPGVRRLFILDCCRDNLLAGRSTVYACEESRAIALDEAVKEQEGFIPPLILNSCATGEKAFEDRASGHGYFTKALLEIIGDKAVKSFSEFSGVLHKKMLSYSNQHLDWRGNPAAWDGVKLFGSWDSRPQIQPAPQIPAQSAARSIPENFYHVQWNAEKWQENFRKESFPVPEDLQNLYRIASQAVKHGDYQFAVENLQGFCISAEKVFNACMEKRRQQGLDIFEIDLNSKTVTGLKKLDAERIEIPGSVTAIGNNAFRNCTTLTRVVIPAGVTSIGARAFNGCSRLAEVKCHGKISSIGDLAFYDCPELKKIIIPQECFTGELAFSDNCRVIKADCGMFDLMQKAADGKISAEEQLALGRFLYDCEDLCGAAECFQKAAEEGNAEAQCELGVCFANGEGIGKNSDQALYWYKKSAGQGNIDAMFNMGGIFDERNEVQQAFHWYQQAADKGSADAQYSLGLCYELGRGVFVDPEKAFFWYEKAAGQDYPEAQERMAEFYAEGEVVKKDPVRAFHWYKCAADNGVVSAQYQVGESYFYGIGVAKDRDEAFRWYQQAAGEKHPGAICQQGYCYEYGIGTAKDLRLAFGCYQDAAERGDAGAMYRLGRCYHLGIWTAEDPEKAFKWFRLAGENEYEDAYFYLGWCYDNGEGTAKNAEKAFYWYEKGAEAEDDYALFQLGMCYHLGKGTSKNFQKALSYYLQAAENGHAGACYSAGWCYDHGEGTAKDEKKAFYWYQKALEKDSVLAPFALAECYRKGVGIKKNLKKAVEYYQKAVELNNNIDRAKINLDICNAELGDAGAQFELSLRYSSGNGVDKDLTAAFKWLKKSAKQGNAFAQNNLGVCYHNGEGVKQNLHKAAYWYKKSARKGNEKAKDNLQLIENHFRSLRRSSGNMSSRKKFWLTVLFAAGIWSVWFIYKEVKLDKSFAAVQKKTDVKEIIANAENGDVLSQVELARKYEEGREVEKSPQEALKWYQKAAEKGYAEAQYQLARCYEDGKGTEKNLPEAIKWYQKSAGQGNVFAQFRICKYEAEKGDAKAMFNLAKCYDEGNGTAVNPQEAFKWYKKAAEKKYTDAYAPLAAGYFYGKGTDKNLEKAVYWYQIAAMYGNADAQTRLADCYENGIVVKKNIAEAVALWKSAAAKGNAEAQYKLGNCYENGNGVEKDLKKAVQLFKSSAEKGYPRAQNSFGFWCQKGVVVDGQDILLPNPGTAFYWYKKAADQGVDVAQYNVGICYYHGIGVKVDHAEAFRWTKMAADKGFAGACCNLGYFYNNGVGVQQNIEAALYWTHKAAEKGDLQAMYNLGDIYEYRKRDEKNAQLWFKKAAAKGHKDAKERVKSGFWIF